MRFRQAKNLQYYARQYQGFKTTLLKEPYSYAEAYMLGLKYNWGVLVEKGGKPPAYIWTVEDGNKLHTYFKTGEGWPDQRPINEHELDEALKYFGFGGNDG